ncbi:MAG: two-component system, sporulation sensor kinase [Thermotogaceae bacterium]|nr:two-component system, sporulation sensor kinase [Thermotogaceae bacterium]
MSDQLFNQLKLFKTLLNLDIVNSDESVNELAEELSYNFSSNECAVFIFENEKQAFRLFGISTLDKSLVKVLKIKVTDIPNYQQLKRGNIVKIEDESGRDAFEFLNSPKLSLFPVIDNHQVVGMIVFGYEDDVESLNLVNLADLLRSIGKIVKLSIENRLFKENTSKLLSLTRLHEIVNKSRDEETLYRESMNMTCTMLNVENASIWLKNDSDELEIKYWYGIREEQILRKTIPVNHGMVGWCFDNREPVLSISAKKDPRAALDMLDVDIKSAIAAPLYHDNDIYGVIILINRKDQPLYRPYKHFDEIDLALLEDIASRISLGVSKLKYVTELSKENKKFRALTLANERLLSQQKEQVRWLKNITYINRAMRESYDVKNIQSIMLLGITSERGLGFDRALLLQKNDRNQTLVAKYWMGIMSEDEMATKIGSSTGQHYGLGNFTQYLREKALTMDLDDYADHTVRNRVFPYKSHIVFEKVVTRKKIVKVIPEIVEEWGNEYRELAALLGTEEFVVVPLVGRFETVGVLILDNRFSGKEISVNLIDVLKIFSDNAGLAIENVQNYEELKSKTLSLERQTSLLNYHKEFTTSILESLDVAIIVLDREDKIREWNRRAESVFKHRKEEVLGLSFDNIEHSFEDLENVAEKVYETKDTIVLTEYEMKVKGETTFFDIKFTPLRHTDSDQIEGIIIMFDNVTQKKLMENEIRRREKLSTLGEMSARVAHEIRNPLSVIGGFTQRMSKSLEAGEERRTFKYLSIIESEVKRLEKIVEEILEFSRPMKRLEFELVNINKVIDDLVTLYEDKIDSKGIELKKEVHSLEIMVDVSRIKQAMINLIQNAIDACKGYIEIVTEQQGEFMKIKFLNDGEVLDKETQDKIFSPFFTTKTSGTGLGLPITKKIIEEEHNGSLTIETEVRKDREYTVFIIEIPIKLSEQEE